MLKLSGEGMELAQALVLVVPRHANPIMRTQSFEVFDSFDGFPAVSSTDSTTYPACMLSPSLGSE